jgi:hypothetical protein
MAERSNASALVIDGRAQVLWRAYFLLSRQQAKQPEDWDQDRAQEPEAKNPP